MYVCMPVCMLGVNQKFIPSNHDGGLAKICQYTVDEWMQVKLNRKGRRSMWEPTPF